MKITFQPLDDPVPVRPADMPEGVAFETTLAQQPRETIIRMREGNGIFTVTPDGNRGDKSCVICNAQDASPYGPALRRRDGKPLPDPEPVRLDTLEPFPVWYRDEYGFFWSHDEEAGLTRVSGKGEIQGMFEGGAFKKSVIPAPHIMEVQP